MKKLEVNEIKKIEVEILKYVDSLCKKNNINYWIDSGTLLGAVRHKGFIPWDDDIDIAMMREEYEKFIKLFNNRNSKYLLKCYEKDKNWFFPYAKVIDSSTVLYEPNEKVGLKYSVFIDVFVFDKVPQNKSIVNMLFRKRDLYKKLNMYQVYEHSTIKNRPLHCFLRDIIHKILVLFPRGVFIKKIIKNAQKYNDLDTENVGCLVGMSKKTPPRKYIKEFTELEFEGYMFQAPLYYHEWLQVFYGDYMKLPPQSERITHHDFIAYKIGGKK